jgi:hypothetical protein
MFVSKRKPVGKTWPVPEQWYLPNQPKSDSKTQAKTKKEHPSMLDTRKTRKLSDPIPAVSMTASAVTLVEHMSWSCISSLFNFAYPQREQMSYTRSAIVL